MHTMTWYTEGVAISYNKKVKLRPLSLGHMVLKCIANPTLVNKLESKWEGPYVVSWMTRLWSYYLDKVDDKLIGHTWNTKSLHKYYS